MMQCPKLTVSDPGFMFPHSKDSYRTWSHSHLRFIADRQIQDRLWKDIFLRKLGEMF